MMIDVGEQKAGAARAREEGLVGRARNHGGQKRGGSTLPMEDSGKALPPRLPRLRCEEAAMGKCLHRCCLEPECRHDAASRRLALAVGREEEDEARLDSRARPSDCGEMLQVLGSVPSVRKTWRR